MEPLMLPFLKTTFSGTDVINTGCFSPDQTKLCFAGNDEKVILTNLQNNQTEKVFSGHEDWIIGSDFSFNGELLVTGSWDETIRIWNVTDNHSDSGKFSTILKGHSRRVNCVRFLRKDSKNIISGSADGTIKMWNIELKKEISTFLGESPILSVDILPDNQTLVNGEYMKVRIWDLRSEKCVKTLDHQDDVNSVQFHSNSFFLASGGDDKTIKIFDFRTFQLLQNYQEQFSDGVTSVCFHPSGKYLLSGSYDCHIKLFDLSEKKVFFSKEEQYDVEFVQFSPDGKFFTSFGDYEKVHLWDFPLGRIMIHEDNNKDIDEEERVKYLIQKDLHVDCCEQNVLKIKIDNYNFFTLYSYKFFFV